VVKNAAGRIRKEKNRAMSGGGGAIEGGKRNWIAMIALTSRATMIDLDTYYMKNPFYSIKCPSSLQKITVYAATET